MRSTGLLFLHMTAPLNLFFAFYLSRSVESFPSCKTSSIPKGPFPNGPDALGRSKDCATRTG